jgi:hypothetical protein
VFRATYVAPATVNDGHEPLLEAAPVAQRRELLVRLDERDLRDVIRVERVEHDGERTRQRRAAMAPNERSNGCRVAGKRAVYELVVGVFTWHVPYMTPVRART